MSDLNDQSEVCFDHPSPSLAVTLFNTRGQSDLILGSQQPDFHYLPQVTLNGRIRIFTGHPTNFAADGLRSHSLVPKREATSATTFPCVLITLNRFTRTCR